MKPETSNTLFPSTPKLEVNEKRKQKQEFAFLGNERKVKGHTLFEYNRLTGKIKVAEYKKIETYEIGKAENMEVVVNKDCIYLQALNEKNAIKRLKRDYCI